MRTQSISSINKYNKCPALYDLEYHHGFKQEGDRTAMDRGTCVHAGIEQFLRTKDADKAYEAALQCETGSIPDEIRTEAADIVHHYIHYLADLEPLIHDGAPMLEFEFDETFTKYNVSLRGKIDAVVTLPNGEIAMIDWKCRADGSRFYRDDALQMDRQLLVYAAILYHRYGIKVDRIYQVQLSAKLPFTPKVYKGKKGNKIEHYQIQSAPTTAKALQESIADLDPAIRDALSLRFFDSIKPDDYFIRFSEVNPAAMDLALRYTLLNAQKIDQDKEFLPILDAYICKFCPALRKCRELKMGGAFA